METEWMFGIALPKTGAAAPYYWSYGIKGITAMIITVMVYYIYHGLIKKKKLADAWCMKDEQGYNLLICIL